MTVNAEDLGPLFSWRSGKSGTAPDRRDRGESLEESGPNPVRSGKSGTSIFRDCGSSNDSAQSGRSGISPPTGDTGPDFSAVPSVSSAALTLRSQRTDTGDSDSRPGSATSQQQPISAGELTGRPYQVGAITATEEQFRSGVKRTLVVLPTGTGKTIVLALLLLRYKLAHEGRRGRALVVAHRTELIEQNAEKCRLAGLTTSIEQGESRASRSSDVVVGSVQTLQRARLLRFEPDEFDYIVIDEAHHSEAQGYQNIIERFPFALVVGLTATPMRLDGKPLGNTFQSVAYTLELRQAIADEWLVPIVARRIRITDVDFSRVKAAHGDLSKEDLGIVLREMKALQGVVGPTLSMTGSRRTLIFAVDVAHAHALAELLNEQKPGSAMALDGDTPKAKRAAIRQLFREGHFQYLVNCEVLTEGFDDPGIECVVLARPTMSVALLIQMIGRGTRLKGKTYAESCANGKRDVLVLDFPGNLRHRIAGPADALAGMLLPPELAAEIDGKLTTGKPVDVSLILAGAEEKVAEELRKKALLALAHYREKEVDPFVGDFMPPIDESHPSFHRPATDGQLAAIEKWGMSKPPEGLTLGEASRILDGLGERKRLGLATMGQVQLLRKFKLDCSSMTKERATELFLQGKKRGFQERNFVFEPEYRKGKFK